MANWLAPLKNLGGGFLGLSSQDRREIIMEGADIIMKQRRTDLFPQILHEVPHGASVLNDIQALEIFLTGLVAASVKLGTWQTSRFAYEAKAFSGIQYSTPWRAFASGLARHDCHPILLAERNVYVFAGKDWHVGQVKIAIGLE